MTSRKPRGAFLVVIAFAACVPEYAFQDSSDASGDASLDAGDAAHQGADTGGATDAGQSADAARDADARVEAGPNGCLSGKGWPTMSRFDVLGKGSFCIDPYEVTQGQFNEYLNDPVRVLDMPPVCNAEKSGTVPGPQPVTGRDNLPVGNINFCDAWSYCKWAGKRLCSSVGGPDAGGAADDGRTTNEWVYACANGARNDVYPYGNAYEIGTCNIKDDDGGPNGTLTPPGAYTKCHGIGAGYSQIFDMSGNQAEMDDWATSYADSPDAAKTTVHALGGAYDYNFLSKCGDHFPHAIFDVYSDVGFRCCADVAP